MLGQPHHRVHSISESLNVYGWAQLDAIILAALATEFPLLLVGAHGTAKTYLAEQISQVLGMEFRHYNASLINYDDLVGIPMPDENQESLHFVSSVGSIWQAEFVFFDEISRCRPDLQNKLFPVVHEKRVIGISLDDLRFRWAAMNPPSPDDSEPGTDMSEIYLGSEPLDPALTDRFPFIVTVPTWGQLSRNERRQLLNLQTNELIEYDINNELIGLVNQCAELIPEIQSEHQALLSEYLIYLIDLLEKAKLPQSPRRARMLMQTIVAIHAARIVLEEDLAELSDSAELALSYGLPQYASEVPPSPASVLAAHQQAWDIANCLDDENWRTIMEESDHIKRVALADELGFDGEDLSQLITQALNVEQSEAEKIAVATAMFLAFRNTRALTPAAWEPLSQLSIRALQPRLISMSLGTNSADMRVWERIKDFAINHRIRDEIAQLEANYVLGCFPDMWCKYSWQESLEKFREYISLFGVKGAYDE